MDTSLPAEPLLGLDALRTETDDITVSVASRRLRALASLSGSLTDALDPPLAARLVEAEALAAMGATGAVVVTLGAFPNVARDAGSPGEARLHLVEAFGASEELMAALQGVPLDAPIPFAEVARSGEPLFLPSARALAERGQWGEMMLAAGAAAYAIVPVWANGELRGVLGMSWPEPHEFDEDERAFVLTLGIMCAQAILRSHLRAAESRAREDAERANRSKANFLTMISHELRTPMNAVIGYSELISRGIDGPITPKQGEHLARMQSSSTHLLALIEELLGYARLEAGRDVVIPEETLLIHTIEQTLDVIQPLAEAKGLRVRVEAPDEPVTLFTDPRKLLQILINLLANAIKFTEIGEVFLLVHVSEAEEIVRIIFEVRDDGPGIAEDAQADIFEAFSQIEPTSTLSWGGTGLGLSIARQLARLLGGDVTLGSSTRGQGSTFVVSLPLRYGVAKKGGADHN